MDSLLILRSQRLMLRPPTAADATPLAAILAEPEVARYWPGYDSLRIGKDLLKRDDDVTVLVIEHQSLVIGAIQFNENEDPEYHHASIDLFLGTCWQGQGLGSEAIRAVIDHLFVARGHHRIIIDPAADNLRAIRTYERLGFRRVGVMRQYERGADGSFHDGLLLELLNKPGGEREGPRFIDVSHTIEHGLITYPGIPAPIICDYLSRAASRALYAAGTEFHIGRIDMVANTGTYVDSPFHRYEDGKDLAELELKRLANVEAVVLRMRNQKERAIEESSFAKLNTDLRGKAVLVDTGWDRHFGTARYFEGHPFLTESAARFLTAAGAAIVGIDSLNIDDTADPHRPVHSHLLGADVPIVEHLTRLDAVPEKGARFFAVPVKVRALGTFPVRAFALVEG